MRSTSAPNLKPKASQMPDCPVSEIPLIKATPETLDGYGKLVTTAQDCEIEIVQWPAPGRRPVEPGTGDEGGTTEGVFACSWEGYELHTVNEAVGGNYVAGWSREPYAITGRIDPPSGMSLLRVLLPALFIAFILLFSYTHHIAVPGGTLLIVAAVIGGYMAMNIGANDVANNVGPAVGSKAMTLTMAVIIAAVFEAAGAFIAGGDVVGTIKKGIIDPGLIRDSATFIWLMLAALLATSHGQIGARLIIWLASPPSSRQAGAKPVARGSRPGARHRAWAQLR